MARQRLSVFAVAAMSVVAICATIRWFPTSDFAGKEAKLEGMGWLRDKLSEKGIVFKANPSVAEPPQVTLMEPKRPNPGLLTLGRIGGASIGAVFAYRIYPMAEVQLQRLANGIKGDHGGEKEGLANNRKDDGLYSVCSDSSKQSPVRTPDVARAEGRGGGGEGEEKNTKEEEKVEAVPDPDFDDLMDKPDGAGAEDNEDGGDLDGAAAVKDKNEYIDVIKKSGSDMLKALPPQYIDKRWSMKDFRLRFFSATGLKISASVMEDIFGACKDEQSDGKISTEVLRDLIMKHTS